MLKGSCLCGATGWTYDGPPQDVTICNCSSCRRYGAVWAYGHVDEGIALTGTPKAFSRGEDPYLEFRFCPTCGATLAWVGRHAEEDGRIRIAVNLRLVTDPEEIRDLPLLHFEGARTMSDVTPDSPSVARRVDDLWI
jgi:hypothetical protein